MAQLKELAASRQLRPQDTVWKEGVARGVPAARVEHLFPASRAEPSPAGKDGQEAPVPPAPAADAAAPPPAAMTPLAARLAMPEDLELARGAALWEAPVETAVNDSLGPDPADGPGGETPWTASPSGQEPLPARQEGRPPQQQVRKRRGLGVKGGVIMSQDGVALRYRKKCLRRGGRRQEGLQGKFR